MEPADLTWDKGLKILHAYLPGSALFENPEDLSFDSAVTVITSGGRLLHPLEVAVDGADKGVMRKLLTSAAWSATGKVLVIPDCGDVSKPPLLCQLASLLQMVENYSAPSTGCGDVLFVRENGEALLIDHDERCWHTLPAKH
ncbi:MAG: hypothetical protein V4726_04805 [Verrucomicrobiota bacterium]